MSTRRCPITDERGLQCVADHVLQNEHAFPKIRPTAAQRAALVGTLGLLDAISTNYPGLRELTLAKTRDLLAAWPDLDKDVRRHLVMKDSL